MVYIPSDILALRRLSFTASFDGAVGLGASMWALHHGARHDQFFFDQSKVIRGVTEDMNASLWEWWMEEKMRCVSNELV